MKTKTATIQRKLSASEEYQLQVETLRKSWKLYSVKSCWDVADDSTAGQHSTRPDVDDIEIDFNDMPDEVPLLDLLFDKVEEESDEDS